MDRIVVQSDVCSGCRACELACVAHHERAFGTYLARIKVVKIEPEGSDIPNACRLCRRPGCGAACPTQALSRDATLGVMRLDADLCIGCGACVDGCPFGMVTLHPDTGYPLICDLCEGDPSCVKRCATGAIRFSDEQSGARTKRERLAGRKIPPDAPTAAPSRAAATETTAAPPPGTATEIAVVACGTAAKEATT